SVLFFYCTCPPCESSIFFPYTSLFRSMAVLIVSVLYFLFQTDLFSDEPEEEAEYESIAIDFDQGSDVSFNGETIIIDPGHGGKEDRKSTRLNSSHVSILYAVFCLKKQI